VLPVARLVNARRARKLPRSLVKMLVACGLRGAVAYGLVVNMPRQDRPGEVTIPAFETATLLIVVVSTLGLGSATAPLLRHLGLEGRSDEELYGAAWAEEVGGAGGAPPPRLEAAPRSAWAARFLEVDEAYLRPVFGGRSGGEAGGAANGGGPGLARPLFDAEEQHAYEPPPAPLR
jgi:hypothetical protein